MHFASRAQVALVEVHRAELVGGGEAVDALPLGEALAVAARPCADFSEIVICLRKSDGFFEAKERDCWVGQRVAVQEGCDRSIRTGAGGGKIDDVCCQVVERAFQEIFKNLGVH